MMPNRTRMMTCLLIFTGIALGLAASEAYLRLRRGPPPPLDRTQSASINDLFRNYIDIRSSLFTKDISSGLYRIQRRYAPISDPFEIIKPARQKRIFVIGESVALQYNEGRNYLRSRLSALIPGYDWRIIICGMSGYDAYRIKLIAGEIAGYQPDLIILISGNNSSIQPARINHLKYEHPLLASCWVFRIITDAMFPPVPSAKSKEIEWLEGIREIIGIAGRSGTPLVITTLPNNMRKMHSGCEFPGHGFKPYWTVWHAPRSVINDPTSPERLRAKAYEIIGDESRAKAMYSKSGYPFPRIKVRNHIMRDVVRKTPGCILLDFERYILKLGGGAPGYEFFTDETHFLLPVYDLFSDQLIQTIFEHNRDHADTVLAPIAEWNLARLSGAALGDVMRRGEAWRRELAVSYLNGTEKISDRHTDVYAFIDTIMTMYARDRELFKGTRYVTPGTQYRKSELYNLIYTGETLRLSRKYQDALRCLNAALALDGKSGLAYFVRALIKFDMNDPVAAQDDFATARLNGIQTIGKCDLIDRK